jgi:secondary thiamine-phosphate synthase enzyme
MWIPVSEVSPGLNVQHVRPRRTVGFIARDITADVNAAVRDSGIQTGIACVSSSHPTCCVRLNELEAGLLEDFAALLLRLIPDESPSFDLDGRRARCASMLLGPAGEAIPVSGGELSLGRWQSVLFLEMQEEHDGDWQVEVVGA